MTDDKVRELKAIMLVKGVNIPALANAMGIHANTLYRKLEKGQNFTRSEMDTMRKVLSLSDEQTMSIFFS